MRALPVARAPPIPPAAPIGRRAPLRRALAASCPLISLRLGRRHGAPASSRRLAALERAEAVQQRLKLRSRGTAGLDILRHCRVRQVRDARRPLGRVVRAQSARSVSEAQQHPRRGASAPLASVPRGLQHPLRRGAAAPGAQARQREAARGGGRGRWSGRVWAAVPQPRVSGLTRSWSQPETPKSYEQAAIASAGRPSARSPLPLAVCTTVLGTWRNTAALY